MSELKRSRPDEIVGLFYLDDLVYKLGRLDDLVSKIYFTRPNEK